MVPACPQHRIGRAVQPAERTVHRRTSYFRDSFAMRCMAVDRLISSSRKHRSCVQLQINRVRCVCCLLYPRQACSRSATCDKLWGNRGAGPARAQLEAFAKALWMQETTADALPHICVPPSATSGSW